MSIPAQPVCAESMQSHRFLAVPHPAMSLSLEERVSYPFFPKYRIDNSANRQILKHTSIPIPPLPTIPLTLNLPLSTPHPPIKHATLNPTPHNRSIVLTLPIPMPDCTLTPVIALCVVVNGVSGLIYRGAERIMHRRTDEGVNRAPSR
jgi:hypothetical protein